MAKIKYQMNGTWKRKLLEKNSSNIIQPLYWCQG